MVTVLLVEDESANRLALARVLESAGFQVSLAADGMAAFNEIARQEFDVIVCDLRMPVLGGQGFYEQLERDFPQMAGRVLFITAYVGDSKIKDFLAVTGQPVLEKPFPTAQLVDAVRQIAGRAH